MLGYVVPEKPELKIREFEIYSGYYCGICKSIEKRYGQIPRLVLNYDSVFLALVIASLSSESEKISLERCPVHPLKKRTVIYDKAGIDYAADIMLLLAYYNLLDDKRDENSGKAKAGLGVLMLRNSFKKLMKTHKEKCIMVENKLEQLVRLEEENCTSMDEAAEPFAKLMEEVFAAEIYQNDINTTKYLRRMGYHLGKWIYLIDAYDDIEENYKNNTYNPLINQFELKAEETIRDFRIRIHDRVEFNLLTYLSELSRAWETIKTDKNEGLIGNIIYFGLLRKTEKVLEKGNTKDAQSL